MEVHLEGCRRPITLTLVLPLVIKGMISVEATKSDVQPLIETSNRESSSSTDSNQIWLGLRNHIFPGLTLSITYIPH